ncbi:MAG: hypothetical protein IJT34_03805, partial [Butyrivibrio sp.]|nr:hypothetical protein [Butyrivibrio sp.]
MSKFYGAGLAVGILVGIIIVVFVMKFWNNDGKMKTRYDEMQEKARGTAYMYAFWAVVICEAVLMVLDVIELELPMDRTVMH